MCICVCMCVCVCGLDVQNTHFFKDITGSECSFLSVPCD